MTKKLRCAIYTRKSTEEGLEKEFNSLDAQREACEAYIKSQVGEGWTLIRDQYDDGGNRMSPIRQKKGPKHIRYYASTASIKRRHDKAGTRPRVRADRLELLVFEKLAELQATSPDAALAKVVVDRDGFTLKTEHTDPAGERRVQSHRVVCKLKLFGGVKRRLGAEGKSDPSSKERNTDLLLRVARAHRWAEELESGKRASALDIAEAERLRAATVMRDLELAWRSPRETEALLAGG